MTSKPNPPPSKRSIPIQLRPLTIQARSIWQAGLERVDSERLVSDAVRLVGNHLRIGDRVIPLNSIERILVIGAGKASARMARGLLRQLAPIADSKPIEGWINVPDDCQVDLHGLTIFGARPPGENFPTPRAIHGTEQILRLVRQCTPRDLCIGLFSGGGSALLALPVPPVTLAEKVALSKFLSQHGADIHELNAIRKRVSLVKGGQLAMACRGTMANLILSDVIGDPLDVIASGPTTPNSGSAAQALEVLRQFDPDRRHISAAIHDVIQRQWELERRGQRSSRPPDHVDNIVIGNNQTAIEGAAERAREFGFRVRSDLSAHGEGLANDVGSSLARQLVTPESAADWECWVSGGEPVVALQPESERGKGGRNQQLVLAGLLEIQRNPPPPSLSGWCLLSGGTDGEDGPTDAAGAWIDPDAVARSSRLGLNPARYLDHNDAYHFFERLGTLLKTGPTHTNVCDLRVVLRQISNE